MRSEHDVGFTLPMLRPMAAMGILLGDAVIVLAVAALAMAAMGVLPRDKGILLAFAVTAAAAAAAVAVFVGGEVGVWVIIGMAWKELGLDKLCGY